MERFNEDETRLIFFARNPYYELYLLGKIFTFLISTRKKKGNARAQQIAPVQRDLRAPLFCVVDVFSAFSV